MPSKKSETCSRGHPFQKSKETPVCWMCWPGYYSKGDLPKGLSAPALRALLNADITKLNQLAQYTEGEIVELHGMGPKAFGLLKEALKKQGVFFKKV